MYSYHRLQAGPADLSEADYMSNKHISNTKWCQSQQLAVHRLDAGLALSPAPIWVLHWSGMPWTECLTDLHLGLHLETKLSFRARQSLPRVVKTFHRHAGG